jgi:hypothetical protein
MLIFVDYIQVLLNVPASRLYHILAICIYNWHMFTEIANKHIYLFYINLYKCQVFGGFNIQFPSFMPDTKKRDGILIPSL